MKNSLSLLFILVLAAFSAKGQITGNTGTTMVPFAMDWEGFSASDLDLSFLHEKPARKNGFIVIKKGHFVTA